MTDDVTSPDAMALDLTDFPDELLRHSLFLCADSEASAESPEPAEAGTESPSVADADVASSPDSADMSLDDKPGPTYHQLVKRELANFIRARAAGAERLRTIRRPKPADTVRVGKPGPATSIGGPSAVRQPASAVELPVSPMLPIHEKPCTDVKVAVKRGRPNIPNAFGKTPCKRNPLPFNAKSAVSCRMAEPGRASAGTKCSSAFTPERQLTKSLLDDREPVRTRSYDSLQGNRTGEALIGTSGHLLFNDGSDTRKKISTLQECMTSLDTFDDKLFAMELAPRTEDRAPFGAMSMEMSI